MPKKCIICGVDARFHIKGSSEYYCEECARDNFSDLELLQPVDDQARQIKDMIEGH
jgi:hypothetical protein